MRRRLFLAFSLLLCSTPAVLSQDQFFAPDPQPIEGAGLLSSVVGAGNLVTLPYAVERVALANERIARVQIISPRELLVTGLQPGRTTLFVWLTDGRRLRYTYQITRDLDLLQEILWDLDERIRVEATVDGRILTLRGQVENAIMARQARERAESLVLAGAGGPVRVIDLLTHPDPDFSPDDRLAAELQKIDGRIEVRRVQVGPDPAPDQDTYILEGRVKNVAALVRALTLAERQLGGSGTGVVPVEDEAFASGRNRGFAGLDQQAVGGQTFGGSGLLGGLGRAPSGLAAQISRGLVMMSASGRVLSFLEVDELPQILVSIRILEIDRGKAKRVGINFRLDKDNYSFGSFTGPLGSLPNQRGEEADITNIAGGNLAVAFVDQVSAITAAIDFLEDQQLARSMAEPNILTLAGEQASVVVGGEVPIPTTTVGQVTAVQGFSFQEFGIRLDIRPAIDEDDVITLEVSPSIIRPEFALSVSNVPGFTIQSVQTTARLYAGQSLVLGGLLDFEEGIEERRLPILGKIPFFRWKRRSRADSELLFVISPRLVELDKPEFPAEPIQPPPTEKVELPKLEWPEHREKWRDAFEPGSLGPDGLPPSFRKKPGDPLLDEEPLARPLDVTVPEELPEDMESENDDSSDETLAGEEEAVDDSGGGELDEVEPGEAPAAEPEVWEEPVEADAPDQPAADVAETAPAALGDFVVDERADPCLNFREEPTFWFAPLDCLPPGTTVQVLETVDEWSRVVLADGREGWMASRFLIPVG